MKIWPGSLDGTKVPEQNLIRNPFPVERPSTPPPILPLPALISPASTQGVLLHIPPLHTYVQIFKKGGKGGQLSLPLNNFTLSCEHTNRDLERGVGGWERDPLQSCEHLNWLTSAAFCFGGDQRDRTASPLGSQCRSALPIKLWSGCVYLCECMHLFVCVCACFVCGGI